MLLAYLVEIGETGAFVSHDHPRYNTSAAFGYAGFIIPSGRARAFGARFTEQKRALFKSEIAESANPDQWERKGASIFRPQTAERYPQQLRVFDALVRELAGLGGQLFYYADEKLVGTPKQARTDPEERESRAMTETLNRVARHADKENSNIMIIIDQINEKTRAERLPSMYGHILGRASDHPEMRRIVEPPMHVDSKLSSNVQFADWVAACVSRAIDYQLIRESRHGWVTDRRNLRQLAGTFTYEAKLHLRQRDAADLHHSEIFRRRRALFKDGAQLVGDANPELFRKMKAAAERQRATGAE